MEKKLLNNKKIFNVIKIRDEDANSEITPKKRLSEIFEILRRRDRGESNDYTLVLHYFDLPESVEICSWDYKDIELEKVQEKKKIKKLFIRRRAKRELGDFEIINSHALLKYSEAIRFLLENGTYDEIYGSPFESFLVEFPDHWDYFETLVVKQVTFKYSFKEFSNINLYFYENLKKLKEEKTVEGLKKKLKPGEVKPEFKDYALAKEMMKFYTYRQRTLEETLGGSVSLNLWNEERAILDLLSTALAFDKLKTMTDLDLTQFYIMKENIGTVLSALKGNEKVTKLVLNSNKLGEEGMYALGRLLVYNKKIKQLDLSTTLLNEQGLNAFTTAIGSEMLPMEFLNLSTNQSITHEDSGRHIAAIITASPYMRTLVFSKNNMEHSFPHIARRLLELVENNQSSLTTLIATCCKLNSITVKLLGEILGHANCTLKSLVLSDNNITDDNEAFGQFIEGVVKNRSLEELKLSNCNIGNRHVDNITHLIMTNRKLVSLDLYNNDISDQQLLIKILKCFSEYDLVENYMEIQKQKDDDETISDDSSIQCSRIAYFDISKNKCKIMLNEEFVNVVKGVKLKSLDFSQNVDLAIQSQIDKQNFEKVVKEMREKVKIVY
jgi:hypothetical protein